MSLALAVTRKAINNAFKKFLRKSMKARTSGFINRVNFTGAVSKSIAVCVPLAVPDYCLPRQ